MVLGERRHAHSHHGQSGPVRQPLLNANSLPCASQYIWIALRLFQAVDSHSGYDFPWSLNKFFPLWSGADHHDCTFRSVLFSSRP